MKIEALNSGDGDSEEKIEKSDHDSIHASNAGTEEITQKSEIFKDDTKVPSKKKKKSKSLDDCTDDSDRALRKEMKKWAKFNKQLETFREEQVKEEVEESAIKEEVFEDYDDSTKDEFMNEVAYSRALGEGHIVDIVKQEVIECRPVKQELSAEYESDTYDADPEYDPIQIDQKVMKKKRKRSSKKGDNVKNSTKQQNDNSAIDPNKVDCETCSKTFKNNMIYKQHIKRVHNRVAIECDVCGKKCPDAIKMYEHKLRIHTEEVEREQGAPLERFICPECPEGKSPVYMVARDLTKHRLIKHSGRPKPAQPTENTHFCELCGKGYKKKWPLVLHMRRHNGEKPFTCDVCAKTFFLKGDLKRHYDINHTSTNDQFVCNKCGKTYDNVHNFKVHERSHNKRENRCDECGETFPDRNSCRKHMYYHGEPQFHCKLCPADIRTPELMKRHLSSEHGLSPFSCEICCQECLSREEKKLHFIHYHHDKSFQCKLCFKEFMTAKHLSNHMKTHSQVKRFKCTECSKAYVSNVALNAHISIVHKGERNFVCDICDKSFGRYNNLLSHKVTHSGVKPFQCVYCSSGYAEKRNLMNHIGRNHPGQPLDFKRELVKTELEKN